MKFCIDLGSLGSHPGGPGADSGGEKPQKMNSSKKLLFDGISDHSSGISAGLFAASLGFKYIEKHFTLSRNLQKSTEKAHIGAMDFEELLKLKRLSTEIELLGSDPVKILS